MDSSVLDTFRTHFSGEIILPNDDRYTDASKVFMNSGAPALIVWPKDAHDVEIAIAFSKQNNLTLSVRSGGHSGPGFGTNTGGLVVDMSAVCSIEIIDETKHIVKIGSGARWTDVATTLSAHGLAISSGDTKSVGVGGLTLGGGIGWLVRKVGLTIDTLVGCEIVTANGDILHVSEIEHSDLFWAIRGGGGNFGIVTYFEFAAYPLQTVFAGPISYGIDDVSAVLKGWRDHMRNAPEELNSTALVMPSFGGNPPGVLLLTCYAGDDEATAMQWIKPLHSLGKVTFQAIKSKPYAEVLEDAHAPVGIEVISKTQFVHAFSDELIDTISTLCKGQIPILQIRYLGGAMNSVPADQTAFAHRNSEVLFVSPIFVPPGSSPEFIEKASENWKILARFGAGTYANLVSTNTAEDIQAMYPAETYKRLATIKKTYDPENIFHQNFNIEPAKE